MAHPTITIGVSAVPQGAADFSFPASVRRTAYAGPSLSGKSKDAHGHVSSRETHVVYMMDPSPRSLASLVLLEESLRRADPDRGDGRWMRRCARNRIFVASQMRGGLATCAYCGRADLVQQREDGSLPQWRIVTVDHFVPLHMGGADDERNFVPSCWDCNGHKKGDVPVRLPRYASPGVRARLAATLAEFRLRYPRVSHF